MDTRRDFLKKSIILSGAAGMSGMLPVAIQRALAIDPKAGSTFLDAEHVVILMQENRSFDHCFGALRGVRGFNDPRAITLPDGNPVWLQTNKQGETYAPFRFDIRDTKITWMGSIPHSRSSQVDANNLGKYDQWLEAKKSGNEKYAKIPLTLGYYNRDDLQFNYSMADAFTICDQNFSSAMTSTWPNRLYLWSGTIRGEESGEAKAYIRNEIPYGEAHWKTFPETLEENGISWKVYQNDLTTGGGYEDDKGAWLSNFGCNPLEFLSQFNARFYQRYTKALAKRAASLPDIIAKLESNFQALSPKDKGYEKLQKEIQKKKEVLNDTHDQIQKWSKENFDQLSQFQKNIYEKAFVTNAGDPQYLDLTTLSYEENGQQRELSVPKSDILYQFRKDVDSGQLPAVSWLVPSQNLSDHPSAPWYGAWLTSQILDALTKNPEVWKKTIFILTYDENDGYFDHVPPFVSPDPKNAATGKCSPGVNVNGAEFIRRESELQEGIPKRGARSGPIGLGFRVPMIIASPWSRGGKVCSQVFDHTSSIQFLEEFFNKKLNKNIKHPTLTKWRRTVTGNLTSAFSLFDDKKKDKVDYLSKDPFIEKIYNAKFKQEPNNYKILSAAEIASIKKDPASSPLMAQQEQGIRASSPLPYQLYADGELSNDKKNFNLKMQVQNQVFGKRAAGSPFKVYAPDNHLALQNNDDAQTKMYEAARSWDYAVVAGEALTDTWKLDAFENKNYHLRLYGPNGFFREFAGDANDPLLKINCEYERSRLSKNKLTGNIELNISNSDPHHAHQILISDNAYKNKPVSRTIAPAEEVTVVLDLKKSLNWYDFTVEIKENKNFARQYAGRVETGNEGFSDPAMGRGV